MWRAVNLSLCLYFLLLFPFLLIVNATVIGCRLVHTSAHKQRHWANRKFKKNRCSIRRMNSMKHYTLFAFYDVRGAYFYDVGAVRCEHKKWPLIFEATPLCMWSFWTTPSDNGSLQSTECISRIRIESNVLLAVDVDVDPMRQQKT